MNEWIAIGSGPGAEQWLSRLYRGGVVTITTNRGIKCFTGDVEDRLPLAPDYYYLYDRDARRRYYHVGKLAQLRGAKLITLDKPHAAEWRHIEHADEMLKATGPGASWWFRKGEYTSVCFSGHWIVQYAINHGAEVVHCVGHEGYRSDESAHVVDYFDGGVGKDTHKALTNEHHARFFTKIAEACPEVRFKLYGDLQWAAPDAANVEVIR